MTNRDKYAGIFFLSFSLLLFELTLIRVYSVTLFYHFAFMAISVAMLGLSAAGLTVHLSPDSFPIKKDREWSSRWGTAFALTLIASLWVVFRIPVNAYLPPDQIAGKLILIYLLSAIPFYFAGLVISGLFASYPKEAGSLYAWDLIGAGLGAIIIIPLMNVVGGESAPIFISVGGLAAVYFFAGKRFRLIVLGLLTVMLVLGFVNQKVGLLKIKFTKGSPVENMDVRYNKWNSFSKVTVIPFRPAANEVYTWCPSPNFPLPVGMVHMGMMVDDGSSSPIVPFDGKNLEAVEYLKYDLTSLCHRMQGDGYTLIIGCGGGRDVLTGLLFDAKHIDAVDINPLVFDAMNNEISDFCGSIYRHDKVDWFAVEGRAFARRNPNRYDLIQVAMIDTWAATTAGAYSLSENTLYTVQAYRDYIHALKPGGMLSFTRFFFKPPRQTLRLVSVFLEAAKNEGIKNPEDCILVGMYGSLGTVLFKIEPFTAGEIEKFKNSLNELGFNLVYSPDSRPDPYFRSLISMTDKTDFYDKYVYDMSPTTDDKPFFFNMLKVKDFLKAFEIKEGLKFNYYATYTLLVLLIISIIATIAVLIIPTLVKGGSPIKGAGNKQLLLYFICIGLSYIMIEVALLQRFVLLLEHPARAASGVIAGMLISSGVGSMIWEKIRENRRQKVLKSAFLIIGIGLLIHITVGWSLIHGVIHLNIFLKVLISAVLIVPLGIAMGIPLPAGLTAVSESNRDIVAWCWALNGAASVIASSLGVTIAMGYGFKYVLIVSLVFYVFAFMLMKYHSVKRLNAIQMG